MDADTTPSEPPALSEMHRRWCDQPDHVTPVGHQQGEPYEPDDHGEPLTGGVGEQCMCGHPTYFTCPDWLGIDIPPADLTAEEA